MNQNKTMSNPMKMANTAIQRHITRQIITTDGVKNAQDTTQNINDVNLDNFLLENQEEDKIQKRTENSVDIESAIDDSDSMSPAKATKRQFKVDRRVGIKSSNA
jgi:hypothetical protein